ncbi:MAG: CxxxxCH/CxxCH domain-containing protein, partial [Desulfuromonas sp.]|nr:CxxxxCH/CxxCH domain-containing protein [Desulfuromonas sp.]
APPEDDGNLNNPGQISLFGGKILCGSCHQAHFADSSAITDDTPENFATLSSAGGDGRLLRANGAGRADKAGLCQTCHTYQVHGDTSGERVGCLVCHGGHANDDPSLPNYYMLRKSSATTTFGMASGLDYSAPGVLDPAQKANWWNDRVDGTATGYCEKCHGDARTIGVGAGDYHKASAVCTDCHSHSALTSFAANCNGCHAYPPAWGSHQAHMGSAKMPALAGCKSCHATSEHLNGLSEVRFSPTDPRMGAAAYADGGETSRYVVATGYGSSPAYTSCDNLYCHSNAAPFDKANIYRQPVWGSAAMSCGSCHGDAGSAADMSGNHAKHVSSTGYAFACGKCHAATLSGSTTLTNPAQHLDGEKDVSLADGGSYGAGRSCAIAACHSNGAGGPPNKPAVWGTTLGCDGCHSGRIGDAVQMGSNAHKRLASDQWIRKYRCEYCHTATVDAAGSISGFDTHDNRTVDVVFNSKWSIAGKPAPTYNTATMVCDNLYCHSDGTAGTPVIREFPWNKTEHATCDSCHGHMVNDNCVDCHGTDVPQWTAEDQWKRAMPMYANTGPGTERANSHLRHLETEFSCEKCHATTVVGDCGSCHGGSVPPGTMTEVGHVDATVHVNKIKDVIFKDGGSYERATQTCSNTACHNNSTPQWGESRNGAVLCLTCHGTSESDVDDYGAFNGVQARINLNEWVSSGHGKMAGTPNYPSGNPPANFPGNPCWYCHDNEVLHDDITNPYRLKEHPQFQKRFEKECVYCHMERKDEECRGCHDHSGSLSTDHQLVNLTGIDPDDNLPYTVDHAPLAGQNSSCLTSDCHLPQTENACRSCHDNPADTSGAVQLVDSVLRHKKDGAIYRVSEIRVGMKETPYAIDHIEFRAAGSKAATSCMATAQEWAPSGCHSADVHIHNTGAGTWTRNQKEDVRNQYVMMGVCLQCHDNDDNGRCNSCHTWSGAPAANPYRLGYNPGTGFLSGSSKASSTHFGFKHFADYEESLNVVNYTGALSKAAEEKQKHEVTLITDDSHDWTNDELVGKSLQFTSGALNGEIRPILVNTANTLTVKGYYPEPVVSGTTYKILDTVWKGGKFCWDCHDPHGDNNIYMIQKEISVKTDGVFGKPLQRVETSFTRTTSGRDYAKDAAPYNGICNVCHTDVDHYLSDYGDTHRSGRRCTDCHSHGFGEGHGSGKACNSCHDQKPVPNHLGFGQPRDCTKCHDGVIKNRTDIMRQFRGQSHHVQGVAVNNEHCYKCHWEATKEGLIDNDYHAGYNYKTHESVSSSNNDMVVWEAGGRPHRYDLDNTAIVFNTSSIGTAAERGNVAKVTQHCLGCHSKQHNDTDVFGDCKTPRQYAWDRTSIAERYLDEGTTNWGKYTGIANAAKKVQTKAFSAHGKATLNQGGWSVTEGEDGTLPNTRAGTQNVQCYDCHNSHGSYTAGITSSYLTFNNTYGGANLKETQAGRGGYVVTYQAKAIEAGAGVTNPMNPGAAQCFDCHETRDAGVKPWGYFSTFGADKPIQSYRDSSRFGGGMTGHKERFAYRAGMNTLGGHLKASDPLATSSTTPINGLCSGCHDPHGVSPSLGADQAYGVPLLKGTWLTSPYKDDKPQVTANQRSSNFVYSDRKTFGTSDGTSQGPSLKISEDAEKFAGLCLRCHPKGSLTDGTKKNSPFKSVDRVHETVKGWGNNTEHNFPCAKCHNAH